MTPSIGKPSDRFIPYYIALGFCLLITVPIAFIFIAVRHYSGEVAGNAYTEGLQYNHAIEAAQAQDMLGWKGDTEFSHHEREADIRFTLTDKDGKPVRNADTKAWFIRLTQAGKDKEITLTSDGNGHYHGKVALAWPGYWEVHISATADGHNFQQVKGLNLQ